MICTRIFHATTAPITRTTKIRKPMRSAYVGVPNPDAQQG